MSEMNRREFCKKAFALSASLIIPYSLASKIPNYVEVGVVTSFTMTTEDGKVYNLGKGTVYMRKLNKGE